MKLTTVLSMLLLLTLSISTLSAQDRPVEKLETTEVADDGVTITFSDAGEFQAFLQPQSGSVTAQAAPAYAMQVAGEPSAPDTNDEDAPGTSLTVWEFIKQYWEELAFALILFIEVIVNLTPTTVDDAGFRWLRRIFNAIIPNRSKTPGRRHPIG